MESINVTSAQKELLKLLEHKEAYEYFESLKMIHYLGTYCVNEGMAELWASQRVHDLLDVIQKIALEKCNK